MNETHHPQLSVLLPSYNSARYLPACLDSLLGQTFQNFEILAIDDGSTDGSLDILHAYAHRDRRIRVHANPRNLKLAATLNKGLELAGAPFIARMDADDTACPQRFQTQLAFLHAHPTIDGCAADVARFGESTGRTHNPVTDPDIRAALLWRNPFAHPTILLRASVFKRFRYDETFDRAQDYELWSRMILDHDVRLVNIPNVLVNYRCAHSNTFIPWHKKVIAANLLRMGLSITPEEIDIHTLLSLSLFQQLRETFSDDDVVTWINKFLQQAGRQPKISFSALSFMTENILLRHFGKDKLKRIRNRLLLRKKNFSYYVEKSFRRFVRLLHSA